MHKIEKSKMKKHNLKYMIQFGFACMFVVYSFKSVISFYFGDVVYEIYKNVENDKVYFPAITLCPTQKINPLMNLKLQQFGEDKNISSKYLKSFYVFHTLKKSIRLVENIKIYSFSKEESFNTAPFSKNHIV